MFMTVIKTTDSVAELVSVIDIVDCDIARWRSKDTGGSDGMYTYLLHAGYFYVIFLVICRYFTTSLFFQNILSEITEC